MTDTVSDNEMKIVTFRLGEQMFAIPMASLVEIREWEVPTPLPSVPQHIKGVLNLRGRVVPVVDLAERLGWAPSVPHGRSCILVVSVEERQCGFLVDEVADIVGIKPSEVQPAPDTEGIDSGCIDGLVQVPQRARAGGEAAEAMVSLLDLEALSPIKAFDQAA